MARWLKIAGALLLLASLALPMGSCTRYEDEKGNPVEVAKGAPVPAGAREVVTYDYALGEVDLKEAGWWVRLLAFVWPAVFAGLFAWRKRGRMVFALRLLEPLRRPFVRGGGAQRVGRVSGVLRSWSLRAGRPLGRCRRLAELAASPASLKPSRNPPGSLFAEIRHNTGRIVAIGRDIPRTPPSIERAAGSWDLEER